MKWAGFACPFELYAGPPWDLSHHGVRPSRQSFQRPAGALLRLIRSNTEIRSPVRKGRGFFFVTDCMAEGRKSPGGAGVFPQEMRKESPYPQRWKKSGRLLPSTLFKNCSCACALHRRASPHPACGQACHGRSREDHIPAPAVQPCDTAPQSADFHCLRSRLFDMTGRKTGAWQRTVSVCAGGETAKKCLRRSLPTVKTAKQARIYEMNHS